MKITFTFFFISICLLSFCQHFPTKKLTAQEYGLKEGISQHATAYYKADSLGYEPVMISVLQFNEDGQLLHDYLEIYGKYASSTLHSYIYKNGRIDSLNTIASADNFSSKSKFYYNEAGQLDSLRSTGVYKNYKETFSYDDHGKLKEMFHQNTGEGSYTEYYYYDENEEFEYVKNVQTGMPATYTYYINKDEFGFFEEESSRVILQTKLGEMEAGITDEAEEMVAEMRFAKIHDPEGFQNEIKDFEKAGNYIYVIPANAYAESGELIKEYKIDYEYSPEKRRYLFHSYVYHDGNEVGDTNFDSFFQMGVERRQLHLLNWNNTDDENN